MLITPEYREQNRLLHENRADYGAGSGQHTKIAKMILNVGIKDVLDYGCGKGMMARCLPFPIKEYDPAIPGKDDPAEPAEMVICRDVLEHVEPECIDAVLDDLQRCVKRFGYFVIGLSPSTDILPDGRNAHVLQRTFEWWQDKLRSRFDILLGTTRHVTSMVINKPGYWLSEEGIFYVKRLHRVGPAGD